MKFPSWQLVRAFNIVSVFVGIGLGYLAGPSWIGMLDAVMVGYSLGAVLWITRPVIPMTRSFEQMQVAFKEMADLNDALIHDRVMFHLYGEPPQAEMDLPDEYKPRLH